MLDVKYIVLENETLAVFSPYIQHADMNRMLNEGRTPDGAGFVARGEKRNGDISFSCYGKSTSLGIPSREKDKELINIMFGTFKGSRREGAVASYFVFEDPSTLLEIIVIYPAWISRESLEEKVKAPILSRGHVTPKLACHLVGDEVSSERTQKDEKLLQKIFNPCFI